MTAVNGKYVLPELRQRRSPNQSSRGGMGVHGLVAHVTVGSYHGAIDWLCTPTLHNSDGSVRSGPDASAHLALREDGNEATQLVAFSAKAWHAGIANQATIGVEFAAPDHDKQTDGQLRSAARIFGYLCLAYNVPATWSMHHGGVHVPGITRHADWGVMGGGHPLCPMTNLERWIYFITLVQHEVARGDYRPLHGAGSWGLR